MTSKTVKNRQDFGRQAGHIGRQVGPSCPVQNSHPRLSGSVSTIFTCAESVILHFWNCFRSDSDGYRDRLCKPRSLRDCEGEMGQSATQRQQKRKETPVNASKTDGFGVTDKSACIAMSQLLLEWDGCEWSNLAVYVFEQNSCTFCSIYTYFKLTCRPFHRS